MRGESAWAVANRVAHGNAMAPVATDRNEGFGTGRPAAEALVHAAVDNHEEANTMINHRTTACSQRRPVES